MRWRYRCPKCVAENRPGASFRRRTKKTPAYICRNPRCRAEFDAPTDLNDM